MPIDSLRVGYGHVIRAKPQPYLAIFGSAHPIAQIVPPERIVQDDIRFLALAGDELIGHGRWEVIGNVKPDLSRIPFPCFRVAVGAEAKEFVENFDGTRRRPATTDEIRKVPNQSTFSGIRLEKALQATHGVGSWDEDYERLTYRYMKELAESCSL